MANSVDPDQTAPIGAVCSRSTLFASILNSSVMLGNYLQQMTSADNIFRCIFFHWRLRVNHSLLFSELQCHSCVGLHNEECNQQPLATCSPLQVYVLYFRLFNYIYIFPVISSRTRLKGYGRLSS